MAQKVAAMIVRVPDFNKCGGLIPAIVQEKGTGRVLIVDTLNE
ncbi:MAG: hypothetical protein Greene041679_351 [Parcubacteria group bacterium Greene0416_79]|nr:MAG: hypothetical protein Greene041679_351 [Parcubacteria group bacterium Greene0416_79]